MRTLMAIGLVVTTPVLLLSQDRRPEFPPPTILEYKPQSTLVVPEHPVPRPKYPVVDFHGHPPRLSSVEAVNQLVTEMDAIGIRVMVQANGSSGDALRQQLDAVRQSGKGDRFAVFTTPLNPSPFTLYHQQTPSPPFPPPPASQSRNAPGSSARSPRPR